MLEELKSSSIKTGVPTGPRGWLRSARKKGGSLITSICIDIYCIKWCYSFKCFFIDNFVSKGSRFLLPGVTLNIFSVDFGFHKN
jgi:hypothetical protein